MWFEFELPKKFPWEKSWVQFEHYEWKSKLNKIIWIFKITSWGMFVNRTWHKFFMWKLIQFFPLNWRLTSLKWHFGPKSNVASTQSSALKCIWSECSNILINDSCRRSIKLVFNLYLNDNWQRSIRVRSVPK